MTPNSRPTTQPISFSAPPPPVPANQRITESYSNNLMDDLFGDVDCILAGDLSACMTFADKQSEGAQTSSQGARTVHLPADFVPRSAADIYHATMDCTTQAAAQASSQTNTRQHTVVNSAIYHQPIRQASSQRLASAAAPSQAIGYPNGGRPMTSFRASPAHSGNFQTTVIQTPGVGTTTVDVQPTDSQSTSQPTAALYPPSFNDFPLANLSPRLPQTIVEPKARRQSVSLPFLLMGAAGISVASTIGLWALGNSSPGGGSLLSFNTEASAAELPNSEAEFLLYLRKSLETISANQLQASQLSAVIPVSTSAIAVPTTVPNVNAAPTVGALPNLPGAPAATPSVIERVFVPVYENKQPTQVTVAPAAAPVPSVALSRSAARPTIPVPAPVTAGGALPTPAVTTAAAPTNAAVTGLTDTTPYSEQVLVGVLNLGSRSAALFDIDGSSQRAYVGDRIGTSQWSLVSVNGQDVVVRRDGEVRSVYIGQRF